MTRIEIYINKQRADIIDDDIHLRINRELWNPEKTVTKQLEWSYSFDLPATPTNNKIFAHANVLSVNNKYHQRYKAEVYADSTLIYDGTLIVNEYNGKEQKYNCNLVNVKINTLDEIFGEEVMTDGEWYVPFSGVPTINSVNADMTTKYFFPMVCYGAFQKWPIESDEVGKTFTPKHTIDGSNKFWVESFYPSLNVLETVRKLFENKGYTVAGSAYQDDTMANIYASVNLAQEQSPSLNVGNPLFGDIEVTASFDTTAKMSSMYLQELTYKYAKVPIIKNITTGTGSRTSQPEGDYDYNFDEVVWWNLLDNNVSTVQLAHKQYVFDPGEHLIVVPADGWYTIQMDFNATMLAPSQTVTAEQHVRDYTKGADDQDEWTRITFPKDITDTTPVEIQLIKNYDENIELIKGKDNVYYANGNPNDTTYNYDRSARRWREGGYPNKITFQTCYPHENLYGAENPTSQNELYQSATKQMAARTRQSTGTGNRVSSFSNSTDVAPRQQGGQILGYAYQNRTETMAYDPAVSEAFICGASSLGQGVVSVQKNGKSWSPLGTTTNKCIANVKGYNKIATDGTTTTTSLNYNSYNTAGNANYATVVTGNTQQLLGNVQCCVWLNKNDLIEIALVQRAYDSTQKYSFSGNVHLHMRAISDQTEAQLRSDSTFNMYSSSRFPTELNLFNFTNKETKKVDWLNNVAKAFNLDITTMGDTIDIDINKGVKKDFMSYAVNIDDRASSYDAISSRIDYPRTMAVKYKISTGETGFENSVPQEYINTEDWFNHGESGYTVIQLSDDSYVTTDVSTQTDFSYTWYDTFEWHDTSFPMTTSGWTTLSTSKYISMPILAESKYFIELASDEEGMKHDGYSLTQRFWFRQQPDTANVRTADNNQETVYLSLPTSTYYGTNMNYKDNEKSILTEYFNTRPLLDSNYVTIDVRLTAEEYKQLSSGAKVVFNDDVHYVSEIQGYDPTGENPTTLKLIKKTD